MDLKNKTEINCAEACVNGCVLGDDCPNKEYQEKAAQFIQETSLDKMLEMADAAFRKKMTQPPQWVFPDDNN